MTYDPPPYFAAPGEVGDAGDRAGMEWPWLPPPPPPRRSLREHVREAVETFFPTVAVLVLLGAPVAFLWRVFAPRAAIERTATGAAPVAPESSELFAVDGWFVVVTVAVGAVCGGLAWLLLRRRGPVAPVALAVGGLLAALVTSAVGRRIVIDDYLYRFCSSDGARCLAYSGTLRLHAKAAVIAWPVAMLAVFAALTLFLDKEEQVTPATHDGPPR